MDDRQPTYEPDGKPETEREYVEGEIVEGEIWVDRPE
jgi:hypothetical protein